MSKMAAALENLCALGDVEANVHHPDDVYKFTAEARRALSTILTRQSNPNLAASLRKREELGSGFDDYGPEEEEGGFASMAALDPHNDKVAGERRVRLEGIHQVQTVCPKPFLLLSDSVLLRVCPQV